MKKTVVVSALAVLLSSMAVQAQSTISWEFDTIGDTEGWHPVDDSFNSLSNGIEVVNGFDSVVLTTPDITGLDPGIETTNTVSVPAGEYWDTVEFRCRTLDGNAGSPTTFVEGVTLMVINGSVVFSGWGRTDEAGEWTVLTYDISGLGSNDVTYLRFDPPTSEEWHNFEFDYVKLHTSTNPPPPPVYKLAWEFNTPGDVENWQGGDVINVHIATARNGGSESVLTVDSAGDADPQVGNYAEPAALPPGKYWSAVEIRIRQLSGIVPQPWDVVGTLWLLNNAVLSANGGGDNGIGGSDWDTTFEADGWITTRFDLTTLAPADFFNMRIDPFQAAGGRVFEIDYVRFETRDTPILPPAPVKDVHTWEFNTLGDTEGWADNGTGDIVGMTVANTISGSEVVLTSSDVIGTGDSQIVYAGSAITPPGPWAAWEIRMRQLTGNPGAGATIPVDPFDATQVTFVANNTVVIDLGTEIISFVPESNGWITAIFDISRVGFVDLGTLRIDAVSDIDLNFEIDYTKVSSVGSKYESWSQVVYGLAAGTDSLMTADPDGDGFNNLYEFGFGGDPTNATDIGFVESSIVDDGGTSYVEYNYARRTDSKTGLTYAFEQRGDLIVDSWTDLAGSAEVGTWKASDDYEVVTNRIETVDATEFHRVKVSGE